MTRPADLPEHEREHLAELLGACPQLSVLAEHVRTFAELLTGRRSGELDGWMNAVEASDLQPSTPSSAACARTCPPSPPD